MENVTKINIEAYADRRLEGKPARQFVLPINAESYSQTFKVENEQRTGHGNQGTDPKYIATAPEELRLEFYFDGTNTVQGYIDPSRTVRQQVREFQDVVYKMDGETHRPSFLKIHWGQDLTFPCLLKNLDINYTLFNRDGSPLRAKLTATFINYLVAEERVRRENKRSPDLTHEQQVRQGDRLDVLTYAFYNDSAYVLQVAKANRLTSIRRLPVTQKTLLFPPFDKTEV